MRSRSGDALDDPKRRGRYSAIREDFFGASLVQRQRERERVGAGVRNVQVLAQRGTCDSRQGPCSPSAMLNTMSGRASESFCGKNSSASSRMTVAEKTQSLIDRVDSGRSSHSAYASDAALASGFSLYARPIRIRESEYETIARYAREGRQKNRRAKICSTPFRLCDT